MKPVALATWKRFLMNTPRWRIEFPLFRGVSAGSALDLSLFSVSAKFPPSDAFSGHRSRLERLTDGLRT